MHNELSHYGVKGMKWGVRRMAKKDAKRHAEAKMFYGDTAGTKRKLLKAELDRKKQRIPGYEDEFNKALDKVNYAKAAKKAVRKRHTKDATRRARITTKQILGITGPLSIGIAMNAYYRHKRQVDDFVLRKAEDLYRKYKRR